MFWNLFVHELGSRIIDCGNLDCFLVQVEADIDHVIFLVWGNDFVWMPSGTPISSVGIAQRQGSTEEADSQMVPSEDFVPSTYG